MLLLIAVCGAAPSFSPQYQFAPSSGFFFPA
jgi:hypothetical protein